MKLFFCCVVREIYLNLYKKLLHTILANLLLNLLFSGIFSQILLVGNQEGFGNAKVLIYDWSKVVSYLRVQNRE